MEKFPCLRLAYAALEQGGIAPAVLNAANEAAVDLFLRDIVRYVDIPGIVEDALERFGGPLHPALDDIVEAHARVIGYVQELYRARAD